MMLLLENRVEENQSQKQAEFTPDAEQLVFADLYIECRGNIHAASIAYKDPGRYWYYKWKKEEGFDKWLSDYAKSEVLKHRGRWYLLLEKFAEKGSFSHLDRLLEIAKEFTRPNGIQVNINTNGETNIMTPHAVVFSAVRGECMVKSECPKP